jgi:hypothetical protein
MWQYILNIIPRIQQFSAQLSHLEVFVDKPWILMDEDQNNHEYVFLRDNRLIMSLNGNCVTGSWQLLPTGKLLINRVTDEIMLQHTFIDEGILVLKKSGSNEHPFMLINEEIISDKDPVGYLRKVEANRLNYDLYKTSDGILINNSNSSTGNFDLGSTLTDENGNLINGVLESTSNERKCIDVLNGVIQLIYFRGEYRSNHGLKILTKQSIRTRLQIGDQILNYKEIKDLDSSKLFDNYNYGREYRKLKFDDRGFIQKIRDEDDFKGTLFLTIIMIILILVLSIFIYIEKK